uniref:Calponin-homology (CH) domain-containing protein n=1 Tax=Rhizochromulina marina TaxID=1034831 RepID=A0A7S2WII2_9STRA|mmetsp:Transcript_24585/g.72058  ORF Transcript_24585/g.72058 Transcript_24585/m.72058 type:complete len:1348 (+) Transcript_24585:91-4134(+)
MAEVEGSFEASEALVDAESRLAATVWFNYKLRTRELRVVDICSDIADGFVIATILEELTGDRVEHLSDGGSRTQLLHNLSQVFSVLRTHVDVGDVTPEDVLDRDDKRIMALVWCIIVTFSIQSMNEIQPGVEDVADIRERILAWAGDQAAPLGIQITDLTDSFADGCALLAIVHNCAPNECPYEPLEISTATLDLAQAQAEAIFGVDPMLDVAEVEGGLLEQILFVYLIELYLAVALEASVIQSPLLGPPPFSQDMSEEPFSEPGEPGEASTGLIMHPGDVDVEVEEELQDLRTRCADLESQARAFPETVEKLQALQGYVKEVSQEYEERIADLEGALQDAADKEEQYRGEREDMDEYIHELQKRLEEKGAEENRLQREYETTMAEMEQETAEAVGLVEEQMQRQVAQHEQDLLARAKELEEAKAWWKAKVDAVRDQEEQRLEEVEEHVEQLSSQIIAKEEELDATRRQLEEADREKEELQAKVKDLDSELEKALQEASDVEEERSRLAEQLRQSEAKSICQDRSREKEDRQIRELLQQLDKSSEDAITTIQVMAYPGIDLTSILQLRQASLGETKEETSSSVNGGEAGEGKVDPEPVKDYGEETSADLAGEDMLWRRFERQIDICMAVTACLLTGLKGASSPADGVLASASGEDRILNLEERLKEALRTKNDAFKLVNERDEELQGSKAKLHAMQEERNKLEEELKSMTSVESARVADLEAMVDDLNGELVRREAALASATTQWLANDEASKRAQLTAGRVIECSQDCLVWLQEQLPRLQAVASEVKKDARPPLDWGDMQIDDLHRAAQEKGANDHEASLVLLEQLVKHVSLRARDLAGTVLGAGTLAGEGVESSPKDGCWGKGRTKGLEEAVEGTVSLSSSLSSTTDILHHPSSLGVVAASGPSSGAAQRLVEKLREIGLRLAELAADSRVHSVGVARALEDHADLFDAPLAMPSDAPDILDELERIQEELISRSPPVPASSAEHHIEVIFFLLTQLSADMVATHSDLDKMVPVVGKASARLMQEQAPAPPPASPRKSADGVGSLWKRVQELQSELSDKAEQLDVKEKEKQRLDQQLMTALEQMNEQREQDSAQAQRTAVLENTIAQLKADLDNPKTVSMHRAEQANRLINEAEALEQTLEHDTDQSVEVQQRLEELTSEISYILHDVIAFFKGDLFRMTPNELKQLQLVIGACKDQGSCLKAVKEVHLAAKHTVSEVAGKAADLSRDAHWTFDPEVLEKVPERKWAEMMKHLKKLVVAYDNLPPENRGELRTFREIVKNLDWLVIMSFHASEVEHRRRNKARRKFCRGASAAAEGISEAGAQLTEPRGRLGAGSTSAASKSAKR